MSTSVKPIAVFLLLAGARPALAQQPPAGASDPRGKLLYEQACSSCHMPAGTGVAGQQPALDRGNKFVSGNAAPLIRLLLEGSATRTDKRASWPNEMPTFEDLNDAEIADVLKFVRGSFGNKAGPVTAAQVAAVRGKR